MSVLTHSGLTTNPTDDSRAFLSLYLDDVCLQCPRFLKEREAIYIWQGVFFVPAISFQLCEVIR